MQIAAGSTGRAEFARTPTDVRTAVEDLLCDVLDEMAASRRPAALPRPIVRVAGAGSRGAAAQYPRAVCPWQRLELLQRLSQLDQGGRSSARLSIRLDAAAAEAASLLIDLVADKMPWQAPAAASLGTAAAVASFDGTGQHLLPDLLQAVLQGDAGWAGLHCGSREPGGAATQLQPMQRSMHNAAAVSCYK